MHRNILATSILLTALVLAGCGDGDSSSESTPTPQTSDSCRRDPDLMAAELACQTDDHCPCGTHCELGVCRASCHSDGDCDAPRICDDFGRCTIPSKRTKFQLPSRVPEGYLAPSRYSVVLPEDAAATVTYEARQFDVHQVRIEGRRGVQVRCDDGADYAGECFIEEVEQGSAVEVSVRRSDAPAPSGAPTAEVVAHGRARTTYVTLVRPVVTPPNPPAQQATLEGRYTGQMRLIGAGSSQTLPDLAEPASPMEQPVDATIWMLDDTDAVIAIADPTGVLTSEPEYIGRVSLSEADADGMVAGSADFPTHPFFNTHVAGRTTEYLAEMVDASVRVDPGAQSLSLQLTERYIGTGAQDAPVARWSMDLFRQGDTTDGRPAVPLDARASYDTSRRITQTTPWEARFVGLMRQDTSAKLLDFNNPEHTTAAMCSFGTRPDDLVAAQDAFAGSWYMPNLESDVWTGDGPFDDLFAQALEDNSGVRSPTHFEVRSGIKPESRLGAIPCAFEDIEAHVGFPSRNGWDETVASAAARDWCDAWQRETGCEVEAVDQDIQKRTRVWYRPTRFEGVVDLFAHVSKKCRLPAVPKSCAEQLSCLAPMDNADFAGFDDALFSTQTLSNTGDLVCEHTNRSATFPIDYRAATNGGAEVITRSQTLQSCLEELATLGDAPPAVMGTGGEGFRELYPSAECVQVGRLLTGLAIESRVFGQSADAPRLAPTDRAYASAYMRRMLGRWLQQNAFVANEAIQIQPLAPLLDPVSSPGTADLVPPEAQRVFDVSVGNLDALLTPRVLDALLRSPAGSLATPDYRALRFDGLSFGEAGAQKALATVIAETLARQAELAEALVRQRASSASVARAEDFAAFWPRMVLTQALASDMYTRARTAQDPPAWADAYHTAAGRLDSTVADLLATTRRLRNGGNILGIGDNDLPLYFRADQGDSAGDRFAAVSDYLVGSQPNETAWAPAMVARAQESVDKVRRALRDLQQRQVRRARSQRDHLRWVENIRNQYNEKLRDYCGDRGHSWVDDPNFNAAKCAIRADGSDCTLDFARWYENWTNSDLQGRFCVIDQLKDSTLSERVSVLPDATRRFAQECVGAAGSGVGEMSISRCDDDAGRACLRCSSTRDVDPVVLQQNSLLVPVPASEEGARIWKRAVDTCRSRYPDMRMQVPLPFNPFDKPECMVGSIGDAYLDVSAVEQDIEQARAERNSYQDAYNIAMTSCFQLESTNDQLETARQDHADNMERLREDKRQVDRSATIAGALKDCLATMSGIDTSTPWGAGISGGLAVGSCTAAGEEAIYEVESRRIEDRIANAQTAHDNEVAKLQASGEEMRCFNDAKQKLVGMETARLAIDKGLYDLRRTQQNIGPLVTQAQRLQEDGYAYLREVEAANVPDPAGDLWADPVVDEFIRDFTLAKRATYLGVRAVEYEFQQSLDARQQVLAAGTPQELTSVLQSLWASAGTRSIKGSRPTSLISVVSLRDDILQLSDEADLPPEMHGLSPAQRLRIVLNDQRYATFDEEGRYLGQRIPFSLAPLGKVGLGRSDVSIFAYNDCAERLWSINAAVLGDEVYKGSDTTLVRMDVLKRNTFYSQWCTAPAEGQDPYQVASVRPARNLFRQPGVGAVDGTESLGDNHQTDAFSRARIQAYINVDRGQLEDEQYANGQTTELGARGLYGDYALFIPAEMISRNGSSGLVINHIEDILVRLDYVSVAAQ